jgi:arginase family enzyme
VEILLSIIQTSPPFGDQPDSSLSQYLNDCSAESDERKAYVQANAKEIGRVRGTCPFPIAQGGDHEVKQELENYANKSFVRRTIPARDGKTTRRQQVRLK